jgi:hypothetical protein
MWGEQRLLVQVIALMLFELWIVDPLDAIRCLIAHSVCFFLKSFKVDYRHDILRLWSESTLDSINCNKFGASSASSVHRNWL